jgi:hypothetical protein
MNVVNELSSELAGAILLNQKTRKNLETPEAVAVMRRVRNSLKTLNAAEAKVSTINLHLPKNEEKEKAVGNH